jgi:N-acetylmuramoyl-L-alanine amidase
MIFTLEEDLTLYPNARDYNSTLTFVKNRTEENLIVIDPGHGGLDGGTVSAGEVLIEKNIVLDISAFLTEELRARGFNAYNLREEDVFLGLKERTDIANHLGASSVISIHVNAYEDTSVNGTLTMYKDSLDLARSIQNNLVASIRSTDIGLVKMLDRAILNGAEMDSVIVEIGFLSNPIEAEKLNTEEYQRKAASGIADGIAEYYENKENTDGTQGN